MLSSYRDHRSIYNFISTDINMILVLVFLFSRKKILHNKDPSSSLKTAEPTIKMQRGTGIAFNEMNIW